MYWFNENRIIYEDNHIIAINKFAGELVQSDSKGDISLEEITKFYLKEKYNKQGNVFLGVIHRIDRPVSGLLLFAKTSKALIRFNEMQQKREIKKIYIAITLNAPENKQGILKNYIYKKPDKNISIAVSEKNKNAKEALLQYEITKQDKYYIWTIELITGRHHQIRCQLSEIGCPIINDIKYGFINKTNNKIDRIYLHSYKMEFIHPVQRILTVLSAPLPDDEIWESVKNVIF